MRPVRSAASGGVLAVGATALLLMVIGAAPAYATPTARSHTALAAVQAPAAVPFTSAQAVRGATGGYTLTWASPTQQVSVYETSDPAGAGGVLVGTGPGTGSLSVPGDSTQVREYFRLAPDAGSPLVITDRSLGIASAKNLRDAGGYRTTDGHWVRMGLVYRSNKLSNLSQTEQQVLLSQGINRDVDLRNIQERADEPDVLPAGIAYQVADVESLSHGVTFHEDAFTSLIEALAAGLLEGSGDLGQSIAYPFMVNFVGADYAYHDLLTAISSDTSGAVVFHCSAGKDRTGWGTAVLLTLLGVARSTVEADYLASNAYLGDPDAVEVAWLRSSFAEVDDLYGSFDNYLHKGLMLDDATIAAIRARLLV